MAVITVGSAMAISAGVSAVGAGIGMANAAKSRKRGERAKSKAEREIESIKSSRATIVNPYENTKDLSNMASDLSSSLSNPFAQLGVATGAAEIQIEEADIALANTLDTLRATGAGAGGATALAQAALSSKKGVAANIEQQEVANEKARAQGEQNLQGMKMSEQQRLQGIAISEGQRVQSADAAGKQYEFQAKENRTNADLDRASGKERQASQNIADARMASATALAGGISAIGSLATSAIGGAGADGKINLGTNP